MRVVAAVLPLVILTSIEALGAGRDARTIDALAIAATEAIRIDGQLTERGWTDAPATGEFQQREPAEGGPPTQPTDVRVLFDRDALYVAVRAFDTQPDQIVGLLTRRDDASPSDWVSVLIDSYYDRRTAFEFGINPAGVKFDRYWYNDNNNDRGWDAVWDAAHVDEDHNMQTWGRDEQAMARRDVRAKEFDAAVRILQLLPRVA